MIVKFTTTDAGRPAGKLADAELHFGGRDRQSGQQHLDGPLDGLKLIGFAVWERRGGKRGRNVTFPARQYSINGERRSFALLRPIVDVAASNRVRDLILDAFVEFEAEQAAALTTTPKGGA